MKNIIFFLLIFVSTNVTSQVAGSSYNIESTSIAWIAQNSEAIVAISNLNSCQANLRGRFRLSVSGSVPSGTGNSYPLCGAGFTVNLTLSGGAIFTGTPEAYPGVTWTMNSPTQITGTQTSAIPMTPDAFNPISGAFEQLVRVGIQTPNANNQGVVFSSMISHPVGQCNDVTTPGDSESTSGTTSGSCVLPVVLKKFNAVLKGDLVKLDWTSAFEENFENFDILRSDDASKFILIGKVPGNNAEKHYSFDDLDPNIGLNYYRLQMNDKDGSKLFSDIKVVELANKMKGINAFPNPFAEGFTLSNLDLGTKIVISNVEGRIINSINVENKTEFINVADKLSIIFVKYYQNGEIKNEKLLKVY